MKDWQNIQNTSMNKNPEVKTELPKPATVPRVTNQRELPKPAKIIKR